MMELQDLRILLALARYGSAAAAGRKLKMSHTTVLRTVAEIEARLGYAIFVRTPDGAVATPEGEELLEAARAVEQAMDAAHRRFAGLDDAVAGTVRLATNLPLAELLLPRLTRLRDTAPGVTLELLIAQKFIDLTRNDADVAVRYLRPETRREHPVIVARTLAFTEIAFFGAPAYFDRRGGASPVLALSEHDVIEYTGHEWFSNAARSVSSGPDAHRVLTTDSTDLALAAAAAGLGVCALPCYLGRLRGLVQLGEAIDRSEICVLFAGDMRHVPRIRAVIDAVVAVCAEHEALIPAAAAR
jgi:DNA-binding transcriptional LysR family regulator